MASQKSQVSPINIGISDSDREKIARGLSGLLADSFSLYLMTHKFHWNVTGPQMIRHLVAAQEATARTARKLFALTEAANDQPTADLVTQRREVHEKTAWMLRSLLEE